MSHIKYVPFAIVAVSILQMFFYVYSSSDQNEYLKLDPSKRLELWRYVTYMLVHGDWSHLAVNVVIQCFFAALIEINQKNCSVLEVCFCDLSDAGAFFAALVCKEVLVLAIYVLGGVTGALGAACLSPNMVVGASAGGYALLLSNIADLILNLEKIDHKLERLVFFSTLICFAVICNIVDVLWKIEPQTSWQAHLFGGLTGLSLGLVLFKCRDDSRKISKKRKVFFCLGLSFYLILVVSFVVLTLQIVKCTPQNLIVDHYKYLC